MPSPSNTVEVEAILKSLRGDGEELMVTFSIPLTEIPQASPLFIWGNRRLVLTVVNEEA